MYNFGGVNKVKPNFKTSSELYELALQELAKPFPSTPIGMFPCFHKVTGGLRPREFTILCGATGSGKTTLMANLSHSLVVDRIPHFVASVETGPTDFLKRLMSSLLKTDINRGEEIPIETLENFHNQHGEHIKGNYLNLSLYEDRFSVEQLIWDIEYMVSHHKVQVAIIDNLNFFMDVTTAANQVIEMDRVIHELIIFCKQTNVHVIMVMHPKKTDHGRVESEFDIKGSSTAVQEAHNVFLWNHLSKEAQSLEGNENSRELKIAKMRRKGLAIGKRLIFDTTNGVNYTERGLYTNPR